MSTYSKFIEENVDLYKFKCSKCCNVYGVEARFVDKYINLFYAYTCPYCANRDQINPNEKIIPEPDVASV